MVMRNRQPGQKKRKHKFIRHNWFRYKKLGIKWRYPKGRTSKMRLACKSRPPTPNPGYGTPTELRGLLKGMKPVHVYNMADLAKVDPKANQGAVLSAVLGKRKAIAIAAEAEKKGIKILNHRKVSSAKHFMYMKVKQKEAAKEQASKESAKKAAEAEKKKAETAKTEAPKSEAKKETAPKAAPKAVAPKETQKPVPSESPKSAPKEAVSPKSAKK